MAIIEDTDFPRLTPQEERMPSVSRLFRRAEELTDEQFDLLAAAWAEDALSGESLAELESVMAADALRRVRAGSFRSIRLSPLNETWSGLSSAIKPSPVLTAFRRNVIPALLAMAAMIVIIIYGPAGAKLKTKTSGDVAAETGMTVAEIPASSPIIAVNGEQATHRGTSSGSEVPVTRRGEAAGSEKALNHALAVAAPHPAVAANRTEPVIPEISERAQPLALAWSHAVPSAVAPAIYTGMTPVSMQKIAPSLMVPEEKNWMLRSVSFLASAVTGKEKQIDGYAIANGCITGINSVLGWEMELEQVSNKRGEPVAVSFSSSLLSFTRTVNKTKP